MTAVPYRLDPTAQQTYATHIPLKVHTHTHAHAHAHAHVHTHTHTHTHTHIHTHRTHATHIPLKVICLCSVEMEKQLQGEETEIEWSMRKSVSIIRSYLYTHIFLKGEESEESYVYYSAQVEPEQVRPTPAS